MASKIVLAGGTGFIGQEIIRYFGKENRIVVLTRQQKNAANNRNHYSNLSPSDLQQVRFVKWDGKTLDSWAKELEGASLVINLAGKTVNCRYTEKNKQEILHSRLDTVNGIGEAIRQCEIPPACWINASSATIYRHATDKPQDENTGEFHDDFSVRVCRQWEEAFYGQITPQTRKAVLRMAITLGPGGVLIPYFNLLKFGLGGRQGTGHQMFSWIHIEDTCRMIEWIWKHPEWQGTFNCAAPNPVKNRELMRLLRKVTRTRFGLPAPAWILKAGAALIGTETELVLKSRWVLPSRITESGFTFKYPELEGALTGIISQVPGSQYRLFS